ncbi:MAG: universal stress protein [Caldilinea sp. CFX5]|nr:universal stress protein [Caldilinea sp. CFX5]
MTKRKVLVPLDGSDFSRSIFEIIESYLHPDDVALVLIQVIAPQLLTADNPAYSSTLEETVWTGAYSARTQRMEQQLALSAQERETYRVAVHEELETTARGLRQLGYDVTTEVQFGDAAERIIEYVQANEMDLVAMTTHGRTGLGRLLLGSVATEVLHKLHVPILLMRSAHI